MQRRSVPQLLAHAALACACALAMLWALQSWKRRLRFQLPSTSVSYRDFRARVQTGDLLLTRASNNWMSRLHALGLGTPVAHVGIAVVERAGDPMTRVFLFESGAPRGSQLRDLEDYMRDGADYVWWRPLTADAPRERILQGIERYSQAAYSWRFLKDLPQVLLGVGTPGHDGDEADEHANSCGDLVARVYEIAGLLRRPSGKRRWFPMHYLDDSAMPWALARGPLAPVNVVFSDLGSIAEERRRARVVKLGDAIAHAATTSA